MAKFDRAIRLLEQEKLRIIGRATVEYLKVDANLKGVLKREDVKNINDAIRLLTDNQYVFKK